MPFCLLPEYADKFKQGLVSGDISPDKLVSMTSDERRSYLEKFVGPFNAKFTNELFESKLLLKNQQAGLIRWAEKISGISESAKKDIIDKITSLDRALNPETESAFLADIAEKRLGVSLSPTEGKIVTDMANTAKELYDPNIKNPWEQSKEYWQARQQLQSYVRNIKGEAPNLDTRGKIKEAISSGLSLQRAVKTGFDLSAPLRQGRALFGTKEWNNAFRNMFDYANSQSALDDLETKMLSNRYAEQAIANKRDLGLTLMGETFTQREENFASKLIDKIPYLKGSERAFTGFLNDLRFNRFVNILESLDKSGRSITDNPAAMKELAQVIGASTGRGTLGSAEGAAKSLATVLFSPRWIASRIEMITNPVLAKTSVARIEASKDLARLAGTSLAVLGMAKAAGANVETDPRSANFGKIGVGNTYFDITGGLAPYIVLMDKLATGESKSATSGKISQLDSGRFGAQTRLDTIENFFLSKTNPAASIARDVLKGKTFTGEKLEVGLTPDFAKYLADQLGTPLLASDAVGAFTDASGGITVGALSTAASLFGVGVQTYTK